MKLKGYNNGTAMIHSLQKPTEETNQVMEWRQVQLTKQIKASKMMHCMGATKDANHIIIIVY